MITRARVLLIDHSRDLIDAVKNGLRENGEISVDGYNDPIEAVTAFKAGTYDLVLLDIKMPGTNGFQVYRELQKVDPDIRICFLTAFEIHESEFNKLFPEMNARFFLRKPTTIRALNSKINEMVNHYSKNVKIDGSLDRARNVWSPPF